MFRAFRSSKNLLKFGRIWGIYKGVAGHDLNRDY